jgi:hypothetical protein
MSLARNLSVATLTLLGLSPACGSSTPASGGAGASTSSSSGSTVAGTTSSTGAASSSTTSSSSGGAGGSGGGPVVGPADAHCVAKAAQPVDQPDCTAVVDAGGTGGAGPAYGATMYGAAGDDDDCKYHLTWTASPIAENRNVTFTVSATYLTQGQPNPPACSGCAVPGAAALAEVYLNDTHPAPNTPQRTTEGPAGTYVIGPVQFDAPGTWTVRFHLFPNCSDHAADSPHGAAAFFVAVP